MKSFDCVVIGGGPGGYTAAVRAIQLGMKTAIVEKDSLGGTCLNWGCIPTKALLRNAEVIQLLGKGRTFGFSFDNLSVDYSAAHKRSRSIVTRQTKRVGFLMKNNGVSVYQGVGRFKDSQTIAIEPSGEMLQAKYIIIATGAKSYQFPGLTYSGEKIINFRQALDLTQVPASALIVGAGPIGMEFATIWSRYGSKVTVVEQMDHVLPLEDTDISIEAEKQFRRNGVSIKTGTRVQTVTPTDQGVVVTVQSSETSQTLAVQMVLVAIGFTANSEKLGLDTIGMSTNQGKIDIDDSMRTSVPHIYAIGDVTGKLCLAHVASAQAKIAVETMARKSTASLVYSDIPRCTFSAPEVASVGLTEQQAVDLGYKVVTAKCPFVANGKAMAMNENTGFAKIVADAANKTILGIHLIGGHVTELVAGPAGMLTLASNAEDLCRTVHPHPTLSEALMEAAHALCGHAIHI